MNSTLHPKKKQKSDNLDDALHRLGDLPGGDGGLDTAGRGINPRAHAQKVQRLILLSKFYEKYWLKLKDSQVKKNILRLLHCKINNKTNNYIYSDQSMYGCDEVIIMY